MQRSYFKIIGWGWYYLSTILDDYSRYVIAWKLCATMKAQDLTDTLELALEASECDKARSASDAECSAGVHNGNHQTATVCEGERIRR